MSNNTPLQRYAYDHIKDMIVKGELEPRKVYSERQFSTQLQISRTPIREALHCLSQDGYVDILPKRGFMTHSLTENEIISIFQMRTAIECFCLTQYALQPESENTQQLLSKLEDCIQNQRKCLNPTIDYVGYVNLDCEFHSLIISQLENPWFTEIFEKYLYHFRTITRQTLTKKERLQTSLLEHETICQLICEGETGQISEWLNKHIYSSIQTSLKMLKE